MQRLPLLVVTLAGAASAQRTWTVDVLNRPGTDFTDLPAAAAAAAPGDVLVVRYADPMVAQYSAVRIERGLAVIGQGSGRPGIRGLLEVIGVPQGEQVVLAGLLLSPFQTAAPTPTSGGLAITGNAGAVHVIDVERRNPANANVANALFDRFLIASSSFVSLADSVFQVPTHPLYAAMAIRDNDLVVASRTSFLPHPSDGGFQTLGVERTTFLLIDASALGGFGLTGKAAIAYCDSKIAVQGPAAAVLGGSGLMGPGPAFAVHLSGCTGPSEIVVDPAATVGPVLGTTPIARRLPVLAWSLSVPPATLATTSYGPAGAASVLVIGSPLVPPLQVGQDLLYVDPATMVTLDAGVLDAQRGRAATNETPRRPLGGSAAQS